VTNDSASLGSRTLADVAAHLRHRGFSATVQGDAAFVLTGVTQDSRACPPGSLFLAMPGETVDGTRFIDAAFDAGAGAALCGEAAAPPSSANLLIVDDVPRASGHAASYLNGAAADSLRLVGVTGTNGKTSCTYLLESVWTAAGLRSGILGTVSARWPGTERPSAMTTPAVVELHKLLAEMRAAECSVAALEVSSHALAQHRIAGCEFDVGVFTNLTRDHLDYHGDEESYLSAKALLFEEYVAESGTCVVNAEDPSCDRLLRAAGARRTLTYSTTPDTKADVVASVVSSTLDGMTVEISRAGDAVELRTRLLGAPNVSNIAAVAAAAAAMGHGLDTIAAGIEAANPVPGRLERVGTRQPAVLVDYAHTPDALERTLLTVRDMLAGGRLICVFGCGGDRDRGKRPMMGAAAGRLADVTVLTSDNPRTEPPDAIIAEIEVGVGAHASLADLAGLKTRNACYAIEPDRETAIAIALDSASADDVVLVAGKGHEDYQETDGVRRHFDDREVVAALQAGHAG
jgi:UDP-N-acetylmuramoyl-L-alanyl-D-glutamate--2,6-diaminopimelate ligase